MVDEAQRRQALPSAFWSTSVSKYLGATSHGGAQPLINTDATSARVIAQLLMRFISGSYSGFIDAIAG